MIILIGALHLQINQCKEFTAVIKLEMNYYWYAIIHGRLAR